MRLSHAIVLFCALLGATPAVRAQAAAETTLLTRVGSPVPYRIDLPKGWQVAQEGEMLTAMQGRAMLFVSAEDLMEGEENPLPVSEAETRRIMTSVIMGSDSLLFVLLEEMKSAAGEASFTTVVREIRTLRGERAAYLSANLEKDGEQGWVELYVTVKDGIAYVLGFAHQGANDKPAADFQALRDRIRESLVFAPMPAPR